MKQTIVQMAILPGKTRDANPLECTKNTNNLHKFIGLLTCDFTVVLQKLTQELDV